MRRLFRTMRAKGTYTASVYIIGNNIFYRLPNGNMDGRNEMRNRDDTLESACTWNNGILEGPQEEYNFYSILKTVYHMQNGLKHGLQIVWSETGHLMKTQEWKNDKRDGLGVYYHAIPPYTKRSSVIFKDDKKHGLLEIWYPNGVRSYRCMYIDDKPTGLEEEWDDYGNLVGSKIY